MRVIRHDLVGSTNDCAFRALASGEARHGDVHVARGQSEGRGRLGRGWISAPGEGLYASFVLRPDAPPVRPEAMTMAAGLALLEALRRLGAQGLWLHWPNDVMHARGKLCGILVEARGLTPLRPTFVLGIGVNVLQTEFPRELTQERAVTSLKLLGVRASTEQVLEAIVGPLWHDLEQARADPQALSQRYVTATGLAGQQVCVQDARGSRSGTLVGLDFERGLALRTETGELLHFPLAHVRALGPA